MQHLKPFAATGYIRNTETVFIDTTTGKRVYEPNMNQGFGDYDGFWEKVDNGIYMILSPSEVLLDADTREEVFLPTTADEVRYLMHWIDLGLVVKEKRDDIRERFGGLWD